MKRFSGGASIGVIGGEDGPTAIYISGAEKWKILARQGVLLVTACMAVWRMARRIYKRK